MADVTGKRNNHVMADIRTMLEALGKRLPDFSGHLPTRLPPPVRSSVVCACRRATREALTATVIIWQNFTKHSVLPVFKVYLLGCMWVCLETS